MPTTSGARSPRRPTAPSGWRRCCRPRCACYHSGELTLLTLLRALTINPAKLLGLHSAASSPRAPIADIILFDLGEPWVVNKDLLRSRSKNTPFDESKMQGRVLRTLVGETVYQYPSAELA